MERKPTAQTRGTSGKLSCYGPSFNKDKGASFQKGKTNQAWGNKGCCSFNEPGNDASKPPQKCKTGEPAAAPVALSETQHAKHHGSHFKHAGMPQNGSKGAQTPSTFDKFKCYDGSVAAPAALNIKHDAKHHGSDVRLTLEPAKPKCSECARWRKTLSKKDQEQNTWVEERTKMLNREKEMDSTLQNKNNEITNLLLFLDQAQQELKDNNVEWEKELERMENKEKETNCIILNQKLEISKLNHLLNQTQHDQKIKWEENDQILKDKKEEISHLLFLLDELEKELEDKKSHLENSLQSHEEESISLKLKLGELREEVQAQKKQMDEEKAALLDITNELQNKEQLFLKQKAEAEKNICNMNSVLKQNKRTINKQLKTISHLEATVKKKENDLKPRTDQWNQLVVENTKALKAITKMEARCDNERQSKQRQVQLQTALDEAERRLVEMEEERSNHTMTMSTLMATLSETQEAFKNVQATIQDQKKEKEEKAACEEKSLRKRFRYLITKRTNRYSCTSPAPSDASD